MASGSFLLANVLPDLATRRSRIFSAITRSAGSSEASGSGTALCSVALAGPVVGIAASTVATRNSLGGTVGAEDVSVEACPACDASVGTAAKFLPCAKQSNRTARIKARAAPTKMQSRRGPLITPSASTSNFGGTMERRASAILRLPTISYLVDVSTGGSADLGAPADADQRNATMVCAHAFRAATNTFSINTDAEKILWRNVRIVHVQPFQDTTTIFCIAAVTSGNVVEARSQELAK